MIDPALRSPSGAARVSIGGAYEPGLGSAGTGVGCQLTTTVLSGWSEMRGSTSTGPLTGHEPASPNRRNWATANTASASATAAAAWASATAASNASVSAAASGTAHFCACLRQSEDQHPRAGDDGYHPPRYGGGDEHKEQAHGEQQDDVDV
jgi:hypothetical protein